MVAAVVLLLAVAGCGSLQGTGNKGYVSGEGVPRFIAPGSRAEPITLTGVDLDGKPLSLATMRGKPTVVTVWGSWCTECHSEAPLIVAAAKQLGSSAHFVGIDSRDPGKSQARSFVSRYGMTWPSFYSVNGEGLLAFPGVLSPNTTPATVVLDAQGRPAAAIIGTVPSTLTLVEVVRQVARSG